jgi:hypothetical protein
VPRDPAAGRHAERDRTVVGDFFFKMLFFGKFIRSALTVNGMAEASLPFIAFSVLILVIIGILLLIAGKKGTEQNSTYLPRPRPVYY